MPHLSRLRLALPLLMLAACQPPAPPPATKTADDLARRAVAATGDSTTWAALRYLQFDWAVVRGADTVIVRRHLWDRHAGRYRLEWQDGDTLKTALFHVRTRTGTVYHGGAPLDSARQAAALDDAYTAYINDTYWLLAPAKALDAGVTRALAPDSSSAASDVLHLRFADVGLTPGDAYWLYLDPTTGEMQRWTFRLQSGRQDTFDWLDPVTVETPAGPLRLATRKRRADGTSAILTTRIAAPAAVPDTVFTVPGR